MATDSDLPNIEFRPFDYSVARETVRLVMAEAGQDRPDVAEIDPEELRPSRRGTFLIVHVAGQPAASGGYRTYAGDPTGQTAELVALHVRPGARRSGVGRALLTELEELARDDDYDHVVIEAETVLPGAQVLYEITGYHRVPGPPGGRDALYRKELPEEAD